MNECEMEFLTLKPADGCLSENYHDGNPEMKNGHVIQQLKAGHLSVNQLVVRRGLTVFALVSLLAAGMCCHFLVPLPESLPAANRTMDLINSTYSPHQVVSSVTDS